MALPIKETPVLKGRDAARFIRRMYWNDTHPPTKKERAEYLRAKKVYDEVIAKMKERGEDPNILFKGENMEKFETVFFNVILDDVKEEFKNTSIRHEEMYSIVENRLEKLAKILWAENKKKL